MDLAPDLRLYIVNYVKNVVLMIVNYVIIISNMQRMYTGAYILSKLSLYQIPPPPHVSAQGVIFIWVRNMISPPNMQLPIRRNAYSATGPIVLGSKRIYHAHPPLLVGAIGC